MRSLILLSLLSATPMIAQPPLGGQPAAAGAAWSFDDAAFRQALAAADYRTAAAITDKLIEERTPSDGQPRQDPLLNAIIGRLLLATQQEPSAFSYLNKVDVRSLPPPMRGETLLSRGKVLETLGQRNDAMTAYRAAANADHSSAALRREAQFGAARQLLVTDPLAARQQLLPLATAPNPADLWQAQHLLAIAASLTGDPTAAARLAERAWVDAARAPPSELAPIKVAVLQAGLAALANDRQRQLAMLASANAMGVTRTAELTAQLPVCGRDGVRKGDFVVFGMVVGPYNTNSLIPLGASRTEVVRTFYDRMMGRSLINRSSESSANGTVVTLSCRSALSPDYISNVPRTDPLIDWFVDRGLYPASVKFEATDEAINRMSIRVDALTARFGRDSPLLLAPKWQVLTALESRAAMGDAITPGRIIDLRKELSAGLRRAGAPEWLAQTLELRNELQAMVRSATAPEAAVGEYLGKQLLVAPFALARSSIREMLINSTGEMPAPLARIVTQLAEQAPASMPPQEKQAWLLTVAKAQKALGHVEEARQTIRNGSLPSDLCAAADEGPKLLEQPFTHEDYPTQLIPADLTGYALVEVEVTNSGRVSGPRMVASMPSGLFDAATMKGLAGFRYQAATRNGNNVTCTGELQGVTWRLKAPEEFVVPPFLPEPSDETT